MKKYKFKIRDRVIHKKCPEWGVGEVLDTKELGIKVRFRNDPQASWFVYFNLELYETPIQRMKRLYNEG